jgi:hypothetical protein
LPSFTPYSPDTTLSGETFAQNFRPATTQRYSLNVQAQLAKDLALEVGYVGARGTHLTRTRSVNQASLASLSNPIRGETTNTIANLPLRVPLQGWTPDQLIQIESAGNSWYNALETSLSKRFSRGLQFLASYTFSRNLTTDPFTSIGANGGDAIGDQNNPRQRYGPDFFNREHRLVVSYVYELPGPKERTSLLGQVLAGWKLAGVTTLQSGHRLTITNFNAPSAFGSTDDRAQLASGCSTTQLNNPGTVNNRLDEYFKTGCFTSPPVIGAEEPAGTCLPSDVLPDGNCPAIATAFGNSAVGVIRGPDQRNTDLSIIKLFAVPWPNERANVEFRTEFFNAFNTPQFDDPGTELQASNFGKIQKTVVNPRVMQFALKFNF